MSFKTFLISNFVDFGEVLTDMERNGIMVDTKGHLKEAEIRAREEREKMEKLFITWASQFCPDAKYINPASSAQIQQFFFGQYEDKEIKERERVFKMDKADDEYVIESQQAIISNPYINCTSIDLKTKLKERGLKTTGKKADLMLRLLEYDQNPSREFEGLDLSAIQDICRTRGLSTVGTKEQLIEHLVSDSAYMQDLRTEEDNLKAISTPKVKKYREITIKTLEMEPLAFTPLGQPQVSASLLKKMAGSNLFGDEKDAVWGTAFKFFGSGEKGKEACKAIGALAGKITFNLLIFTNTGICIAVGQIDATITNFLVPLQALVDKNSRVHCSLNLNTETGRLSSRRPNLQNQPALEKDQYKIRDAFVASPGNTLIVADYGQLELRILAHITNCESM